MIPRAIVLLFVGTTVLLGNGAPNSAWPDDHRVALSRVFVGYVYQQPQNINYSLYTHLCHAFLDANEDGSIRPNKSCPNQQLVTDAHKSGVKVILSLGGWGWDKQFTAIVSEQESLNRFINAVMTIIEKFDYDGMDVDWEYPDTTAKAAGFDRLCRRLRSELDALGKRRDGSWS